MSAVELKRWDGRTQFVQRPPNHVAGLYKVHQIEARDLLRLGSQLNEWEARFLQTLHYQADSPNSLQAYWIGRIARHHGKKVAA